MIKVKFYLRQSQNEMLFRTKLVIFSCKLYNFYSIRCLLYSLLYLFFIIYFLGPKINNFMSFKLYPEKTFYEDIWTLPPNAEANH